MNRIRRSAADARDSQAAGRRGYPSSRGSEVVLAAVGVTAPAARTRSRAAVRGGGRGRGPPSSSCDVAYERRRLISKKRAPCTTVGRRNASHPLDTAFVSRPLAIVRVVPESARVDKARRDATPSRRRPIGRESMPPLRSARIPRRLPATPPEALLTLTLALFPRAHGIVETVHELLPFGPAPGKEPARVSSPRRRHSTPPLGASPLASNEGVFGRWFNARPGAGRGPCCRPRG